MLESQAFQQIRAVGPRTGIAYPARERLPSIDRRRALIAPFSKNSGLVVMASIVLDGTAIPGGHMERPEGSDRLVGQGGDNPGDFAPDGILPDS